jgi:hypothetical protein
VSFDLRPTRVVVTTTVNGAAAPAFELGSLILNCGYGRRLIGTMATPELDARAEVLMIPGKCDVLFEPGSCSPAGTLPCFPGVVREGVELAGDEATLAVDVRTARLRVSVDNAGSPLPDSTSDRGSIVIENSMLSRGVLVPRTGAATVDLRVVPGRYNIVWQGLCSRDQRSLVCGRRTIARDRMISADTEIRHSFSPVVVEGNLTSNGLPTAFHPMGDPTVLFVRDAQDVARALVTREAMATRYFVVLDAGEHEPWWGASGACGRERENSFQCVPAPLGPRRAWTADSVQDYNLTTVTQLFEVTIDGQPVPPAYSQIVLRRDGSSETTTIRSSMDAPLSVVMPPGTYSVDWSPGLGSFATSPRPASLPTFATHVARGVSITADGTQAIELRSLAYAAQLTINGADPPTLAAPTDSRGAIRFLHEGAFFAQSDLARTGPGAISAVIHRGSYSLWYSPPPCGPTIGVGQLCSSAPLFGCGR